MVPYFNLEKTVADAIPDIEGDSTLKKSNVDKRSGYGHAGSKICLIQSEVLPKSWRDFYNARKYGREQMLE
jgi:hypothetical protein